VDSNEGSDDGQPAKVLRPRCDQTMSVEQVMMERWDFLLPGFLILNGNYAVVKGIGNYQETWMTESREPWL
jgi:hypothetical protein